MVCVMAYKTSPTWNYWIPFDSAKLSLIDVKDSTEVYSNFMHISITHLSDHIYASGTFNHVRRSFATKLLLKSQYCKSNCENPKYFLTSVVSSKNNKALRKVWMLIPLSFRSIRKINQGRIPRHLSRFLRYLKVCFKKKLIKNNKIL